MPTYALGVEYLGTAYCGWQAQKHCESVQARVEEALSFVAGMPISVACAGRTDTGVHALGQVVSFSAEVERSQKAWVQGANTKLPADIRIVWAQEVTDEFHARFSARARQYRYVIYTRKVRSALLAGRVCWELQDLDLRMMREAAKDFIGEQDFSSFRAAECQAAHAIREVQSLEISQQGDFVIIDIQANAFLHNMVRNIVGTLLQIGRGEKYVLWAAELLALKDRTKAAPTAPADGLYMINAIYPAEFAIPSVEVSKVSVWF